MADPSTQAGWFRDDTLAGFVRRLSSGEPVPGGGSASAVAASLGAALVAMVAALSRGRPKYATHALTIARAEAEGRRLADRFLELADEDAAAYGRFSSALKLPRDTEAEIAVRVGAIRAAARGAAQVPMACVDACRDLVAAAETLAGRSNANAASDLVVAAHLAVAAAHGAAANVRVNLASVGDPQLADGLSFRVDEALAAIEGLARTVRSGGCERTCPRAPGRMSPRGGPRLLAGAPIAAEIRAGVKDDVAAFKRRNGFAPTLAVVLVGRDAPSAVYLHQILRSCRAVGISGRLVEVPGRVSGAHLRRVIGELNGDPLVSGIIVQMPLPRHLDLRAVIDTLDPAKDVDGIHPLNAGLLTLGFEGFLPATAQAAVEILKRSGIDLLGRNAVVVGRSNVVGKPAALLLQREHATVTMCHSRTRDLRRHLKNADVVVVAVGKPGLVDGAMLARGAVVVDVGINVVDGKLLGDVDFESAKTVVSAITPVPGGVGPVTNAILLTHVLQAALRQAAAGRPAREPPAARVAGRR